MSNKLAILASVLTAICLLVAVVVAPARAQYSQRDEEFREGLKERGLTTLMEAFLKIREKDTSPPALADFARVYAEKALQESQPERKEELFKNAQSKYLSAIQIADEQIDAFEDFSSQERSALYLNVLKWRLELADMLFNNWPASVLNVMEITDREQGDSEKVAKLLAAATEQYSRALEDADLWLSEMERSDDFEEAFENPGFYREASKIRHRARYNLAWSTYYYAYALAAVPKAEENQKQRAKLLERALALTAQDANIKKDTDPRKWYATLLSGLCLREKGNFDEATKWLTSVNNDNAAVELRIRALFELATAQLRQKRFQDALQTAGSLEKSYGSDAKLREKNLYIIALPLLKGRIRLHQSRAENNPAFKAEAIALLNTLKARGGAWPMIVRNTIREGAPSDIDKLGPDELWAEIDAAYHEALELKQEKQIAEAQEKFENAVELCNLYLEKADRGHANFPDTLYHLTLTHYWLNELKKPADNSHLKQTATYSRRLADEFPKYNRAFDAARLYYQILGKLFEDDTSEENLNAYAEALCWFLAKYPTEDPTAWFYLGVVHYRGSKFAEAAKALEQVPENHEKAEDARWWKALSQREELLQKISADANEQVIDTLAETAVGEFLNFSKYAATKAAGASGEEKTALINKSIEARVLAAEVLLFESVARGRDDHFRRALETVADCSKAPNVPPALKGKLLRVEIVALQQLKRFDEAKEKLKDVLGKLQREDAAALARGLFEDIIQNVKELLKKNQTEQAKAQVKNAEQVGQQFLAYLNEHPGKDDQAWREQILLELARVYMSAGQYQTALEALQKLPGGNTAQEILKGKTVDVERTEGLALCYEKIADGKGNTTEAKKHYQTSREFWDILFRIYEDEPGDRIWEVRFHIFYCRYKLGDANNVLDDIKNLKIRYDGVLPITDPELRQKYRLLEQEIQRTSRA